MNEFTTVKYLQCVITLSVSSHTLTNWGLTLLLGTWQLQSRSPAQSNREPVPSLKVLGLF